MKRFLLFVTVILCFALVGGAFASGKKPPKPTPPPVPTPVPDPTPVPTDPIYSLVKAQDFENGSFSPWYGESNSNVSGISTDVAKSGTHSHELTLKPSDPVSNRTEVTSYSWHKFRLGNKYKVQISFFIPTDWKYDRSPEIVQQFHSIPDSSEQWRNPAVALYIHDSTWAVRIRADQNATTKYVNGKPAYTHEVYYDSLAPLTKGVWHTWIMEFKWSYGFDGYLKVYHDGVLVLNHAGPVAQNDQQGGFHKYGIYKWDWPAKTDATFRQIYVDDVSIWEAK